MAKNLKLTIKNAQIAEAINLSGIKNKLTSKKAGAAEPQSEASAKAATSKGGAETTSKEHKEEAPRVRARSRSAFAEPAQTNEAKLKPLEEEQELSHPKEMEEKIEEEIEEEKEVSTLQPSPLRRKTSEELRKEIFGEEIEAQKKEQAPPIKNPLLDTPDIPTAPIVLEQPEANEKREPIPPSIVTSKPSSPPPSRPQKPRQPLIPPIQRTSQPPILPKEAGTYQKLGPTGKHIKDLFQPTPPPKAAQESPRNSPQSQPLAPPKALENEEERNKNKVKSKGKPREEGLPEEDLAEKKSKTSKFKEFRDIKPVKKIEQTRFDARDRQGLREGEEDQHWRKKRTSKQRFQQEDVTIRPTSLNIRIPIALKDLAAEMKLKASQLIAKLFSQGVVITLNDLLEDETTIQLLGHEFGCDIQIDTTEEERIRITDKNIKDEIAGADVAKLKTRPPVVAFMGHVDHGKTSLIDAIRKSNRAAGEAGAITQHIGAFRCSTSVGDIAILDTPGHEAFSAMRARGADVTDIVVLVIAGDEGMRQQTIEAMQHAKAAKVTIVVALNKCDKPNFNAENVYRQLAENDLLPEAWGGQTIAINCSATTGEGVSQLLEMLALQAEILELKADPTYRARGTVLESEMHKGLGATATVLVQNGTLHCGDALVFGQLWGRVKTMHDEYRQDLKEAGPSTPVEITGLSGLPEAGQEFIVVKNEKEAREIAEARMLGIRQVSLLQAKKLSMENLFQQASETNKKILNLVLRADVQGSLEALKVALMKIESSKAELNIIFTGVGEISESDVQLAAASKAVILGFHTQIESHAEALLKQLGVQVKLHNIIYHAIDDVKALLGGLLDKIAQETEKGKAEVKATFKSSHHGIIAGCIVTEGSIHRNHLMRLRRGKEVLWKGNISSLKRVKEDVREVVKGLECGIVLNNLSDICEGDILESYEITYIAQEL